MQLPVLLLFYAQISFNFSYRQKMLKSRQTNGLYQKEQYNIQNLSFFSEISQKKSKSVTSVNKEILSVAYENQNRFFYHDLINKTHGLSLFLTEKIRNNKIEHHDLYNLLKEVQSLQLTNQWKRESMIVH